MLVTPRVHFEWVFSINPTPGSKMIKTYSIMIQCEHLLTTFYASGWMRINVCKRDLFVTSWQPQTSGISCPRHPNVNPQRGFDQLTMLTSYRVWDYVVNN